jgi:hypothetical protein
VVGRHIGGGGSERAVHTKVRVGLGLAAALWAPSGLSSDVVAPIIVIVVLLPPCHPLSVYCVLVGFSVTNCFRVCIGWLENHPCPYV